MMYVARTSYEFIYMLNSYKYEFMNKMNSFVN
jgi:hypothetical protein